MQYATFKVINITTILYLPVYIFAYISLKICIKEKNQSNLMFNSRHKTVMSEGQGHRNSSYSLQRH